ncbi:hypothetical protein C9I57_28390 [Trinickia symbiotica]|uniref:Uncharacterized protein n=1 Tax=Trinickia symbiotica TaxID=863227 RepID=A0A2T3XLV2_9BURK|nr:hypothetical protein [Trinickia symbiotica]PTB17427.1 hypothetical protein C9I57_28390 [Trinickia symbiotica]
MTTVGDLLNQMGTAAQSDAAFTEAGKVLAPTIAPIVAQATEGDPSDIGWEIFVVVSRETYGLLCPSDPANPTPVATAIREGLKGEAVELLAAAIVAGLGIASFPAALLATAIVTFFYSDVIGSQCPAWAAWNVHPEAISSTPVSPDIPPGVYSHH